LAYFTVIKITSSLRLHLNILISTRYKIFLILQLGDNKVDWWVFPRTVGTNTLHSYTFRQAETHWSGIKTPTPIYFKKQAKEYIRQREVRKGSKVHDEVS
jgi:hypothetical protein